MITYDQTLSKAMAICSKAEKCVSDIQKKLDDWDVEPADAKKIIKTLIEEKFIDETRYACYFVRDKFRFNKWGKIKIAYMLKIKKLASEIIQNALDEIGEEVYMEALSGMLHEKARKTRFVNEYDKKAKLYRFAQSRGFENEAIGEVMKRMK
jgi:regulatory protein